LFLQNNNSKPPKFSGIPKDLEFDLDGAMALPELLQHAAVANCL